LTDAMDHIAITEFAAREDPFSLLPTSPVVKK